MSLQRLRKKILSPSRKSMNQSKIIHDASVKKHNPVSPEQHEASSYHRLENASTSSICSFTFLLKRVPTEINVTHISKLCHEKRSPNCHKCCKHMHFSFLTLTKKYYYCQSNRNRCCNNHSCYHIVVPPYLRISSRFCLRNCILS